MLCAERNVNDGFTPDEEAVPETPPPSYSSISRQISAASTISQSSQQREFTILLLFYVCALPEAYVSALYVVVSVPCQTFFFCFATIQNVF